MPPQNENGYQFENDIREFLERVGFKDVPRWGENRETLELGGQEIDAFGRLNNLYIVVDAKTANSPRGRARGVQTQLNTINGYRDEVIQDIKNRYEAVHGYRDCLFIFWTGGKEIRQEHQRMAKNLGIAWRDNFDLEGYSEAYDELENK